MVGAGEVARCVAEIAKNLEFDITLCDFRDEFLQGWQVDGVTVIKGMPDDLIAESFTLFLPVIWLYFFLCLIFPLSININSWSLLHHHVHELVFFVFVLSGNGCFLLIN